MAAPGTRSAPTAKPSRSKGAGLSDEFVLYIFMNILDRTGERFGKIRWTQQGDEIHLVLPRGIGMCRSCNNLMPHSDHPDCDTCREAQVKVLAAEAPAPPVPVPAPEPPVPVPA